jgi:bifunctional non-homologous end joining protein LigD
MVARFPPFHAQLATLVEQAPSGAQWLHELKYDGYRIGCEIEGRRVRLHSRREREWTEAFPEIVEAAARLPVKSALLDGEAAVVLPNGTTSFQALQNYFSGATRAGISYFVFDLLYLDGQPIGSLPLEQRKGLLQALLTKVPDDPVLRFSQHFDIEGPELLQRACALGAEGIVSKRRDEPYRPGRNQGWLKTKCVKRQELVIGGFTDPEGSRSGIGSLLVGYYEGKALRFGGKVGTGPGFNAKYLTEMRHELEALEQRHCPFEPRPPGWLGKHAHWIRPELTGEVVFTEWTEGGHVRHGSFQGIRRDKSALQVVKEMPKAAGEQTSAPPRVRGITITTPERPVYPALGFNKLELARLYGELAERMLPYIEDRPLTLVRCEKGVNEADALRSECKFLRHEPGWHRWAREPIRRVQIQEQQKIGEYLVVDSPEALISLIQGDIVEIHCWNARGADVERPDRIVFDLDPGSEVSWSRVVEAARLLRRELGALGLECWPKLTGGKGLHVVLPFQPEHGWSEVYAFAQSVAGAVARHDPETFTLDFAKHGREKKILIDYKRNHRAAVAIALYSTRALPAGTLSFPLNWRDLKATETPPKLTVETVAAKLGRRADPWQDFWANRQTLSPAKSR